jgi:5'(3')-deoxyribonucleotidase
MKIAVDVEGVLADSHAVARKEMSKEILNSWGFPDKDTEEKFLNLLSNEWHNNWENINKVTETASYGVKILNSLYHVDIVTARTDADDEILNWLDQNNIEYEGFVSTKTYKERLGYDIYIDDNPHMVGKDIDLYLHDQPWNRDSNANNRVNSITQAAAQIIMNDEGSN